MLRFGRSLSFKNIDIKMSNNSLNEIHIIDTSNLLIQNENHSEIINKKSISDDGSYIKRRSKLV